MADPLVREPGGGVRFGVLGPLQVVDGAGEVRAVSAAKQRVVLAALLLSGGSMVSAAGLAEALWDTGPPPNAPAAMRTYVMRLRRALGPAGARITGRPSGWAVDLRRPEELDLSEVDHLARAARAAAEAGEWGQVSSSLAQALGLWRGEPLVDIPSSALARREIPRLAELWLQLTEARIDADLRLGRHGAVVAELRRLAAEHPLREHIRVQLMLACCRCGDQAAALEIYRDARRTLVDELGVEPGRELQEMHQKILAADPDLALGPAVRQRIVSGQWPAGPPRVSGPAEEDKGQARLPDEGDDAAGLARSPAAGLPLLPSVVPRQLPASVRHFAGRAEELERLSALAADVADQPSTAVISAIGGMAGVGKTALALHFAHQVAGRFPDGQLYVDLRGFDPHGRPVQAAEAIGGFVAALGVDPRDIPADLDARAGLYRSLLAGRRMLVVLDNAYEAAQVRPLLPGSGGCLVLVTSRNQLAGLAAAEGALLVTLDVLAHDDAISLLAARVGAGRVAGELTAAAEIINLCGRLPLALAIAAARAAARPAHPLAALAAELREADGRLDALDADETVASTRAVFSWSYRHLTGEAARMLRLLGIHPGPDISAAAAASMAAIPLKQARHTLRVLAAANLITEYLPGRYALHDLLRAYAAEQARAVRHTEDHPTAIRRMLDHYLHTANTADLMTSQMTLWERDPVALGVPCPGVSPEGFAARDQALAWFDAEHAVLVKVTGQAAGTGFDAHAWQLARSLVVFFRLRGRWHDLVATQRIALAAARRLRDQGAQAGVHCDLGFALGEAGQFRQAHAHLGRALRIFQLVGDLDGAGRARICAGIVLSQQGRDREALASTLAILHPPSADKYPADKAITRGRQAAVLNNVGWFHARLGELDQARINCQRALELFRDVGNRYGEAVALDSLAYVYHQAGDQAQAIGHYRRAADQLRQLGALHELAHVLGRLADTCQAAADTAGARAAWQQAIQVLEGMQHPAAQETLAKLRQLEAATGDAR
jgi:DNA-binding SARP family transcriptional activator/tetratricopeptide (TPR) repeat protein